MTELRLDLVSGFVIHNKPLSIVPQFMLTERLWSVGGVLGSFTLELKD